MSSFRHLVEANNRWPVCGTTTAWPDAIGLGCRGSGTDPWTDGRNDVLRRTIEAEVIPRLMLSHRASSRAEGKGQTGGRRSEVLPDNEEVVEFVRLAIEHDVGVALSYTDAVRARGVALEAVFLNLFAPAARLLGQLWEEDICSFTDVTIALSHLQQVMRELSPEFEGRPKKSARSGSALLVALPGDQHTFGVFMLQEFFRRAGWQVMSGFPCSNSELVDLAGCESFDVIGLSVSRDATPAELTALIKTLRRKALNPACKFLVGGRFFLEHPELVARVGADATAVDGRRAVHQLSSLLDTKPVRC